MGYFSGNLNTWIFIWLTFNIKKNTSEEQKAAKEEAEASKPAEPTAESEEPGNRDMLEKIVEEDEPNVTEKKANAAENSLAAATRSENSTIFRQPLAELKLGETPPRSPETLEFLSALRAENEQLKAMQSSIIAVSGNEPSVIEINYGVEANVGSSSLNVCCWI